MKIKHVYDKDMLRILGANGVHYQDYLHKTERLDVEESLEVIKPEVYRVIPRPVSTAKQYKVAEHLLEKAEKGTGAYGVGSFATDERARHFAVQVMANVIKRQQKSLRTKGYPLWHRVYGGFKDELRDRKPDPIPSLIILSNITPQCTNVKLEKIRDILEKYDSVPRIVVCTGVDPITFFGNYLHYPMRGSIWLGPKNRVKE